jgi:hypothetical protein
MSQLGDLEAIKQKMGTYDKDEMAAQMEQFVLGIFAGVDKDERTCETITKKNALEFNRASHYI